MKIRFVYVQDKNLTKDYFMIFKYEYIKNIKGVDLYKACYKFLYNNNSDEVNLFDILYIKSGTECIDIGKDDWESFVNLNMRLLSVKIIIDWNLLDTIYLNNDYLIFDYDKHKEVLKNMIVDLYIKLRLN